MPRRFSSSSGIARARLSALGLRRPGSGRPGEVVAQLTAMQAQEHAYARWSVGQRTTAASSSDVDTAFDEGRLLRTHVLRPTWHYVAPQDLRWLIGLSGPIVDARNARRYEELGLDGRTRTRATDVIGDAVAGVSLTRRELAERLEGRGVDTGGQRMAHLLMHAELHSVICSGPMRDKVHTYASFDERVPPGARFTGDEALAELARRYFDTRGPATSKDFGWWSGLRAGDVRRAVEMAQSSLDSTVLDGRTYWFGALPRDRPGPSIDLVQCYDEVIISYTESRDVLAGPGISFPVPRHLDGFTHVVLLNGRLLGHWRHVRQGGSGAIDTRLHRPLDGQEQAAMERASSRCLGFLAASGSSRA